ncbi:MAG: MBOAT family protein [Ruminococcaceae bacterium]|nr:MBOAT family protein [Oscillospiraceae bacterium]
MVFSSLPFLLYFLPCLLVLYYITPQKFRSVRNLILLAFSLYFYRWGGEKFLMLMLVSICINYIGGLLCASGKAFVRKAGLIFALAAGLGLLGYFKYAGFFTEIANSLFPSVEIISVVLPIGISFYTFQGLSYVIDVYHNPSLVQKNPLKIALYVSLFPQLVAGPIVRYSDVADEISDRHESFELLSDGCVRFMLGLGEKMILANTAGKIADFVFDTVPQDHLSVTLAWVGALGYTAQIYFDFSAYSDMAIGLGKMFGFHFLENFNYPYIAKSVTEFWRRWHMSLSSWFRDYLYIPLGGNRCSPVRHIFNILIVWLATGFWHGASWNFIVWGLYFAILLLCEKYLTGKLIEKLPSFFGHFLTMISVIISWVIFRAADLHTALNHLGAMFFINADGFISGETIYLLRQYFPEWILFVVASLPITVFVRKKLEASESKASRIVLDWGSKLFALAVFAFSYIMMVSDSFNPFIYFRF